MKFKLKVEKEKILIVEGKDDHIFFDFILSKLRLTEYQIIVLNGIDKLDDFLKLIITDDNFALVKKITVFADADTNFNTTFESISQILNQNGLNPPRCANSFIDNTIRIGIYLFPNLDQIGNLETLLWDIAPNTLVKECVENYLICIRDHAHITINQEYKSKIQCYLSGMEEYVFGFGNGIRKNYFNLDSTKMNFLYEYLRRFDN